MGGFGSRTSFQPRAPKAPQDPVAHLKGSRVTQHEPRLLDPELFEEDISFIDSHELFKLTGHSLRDNF